MENTFDLRKILDALHMNRVSIENDRKSYERVRKEILNADETLKKLSERWISVQQKVKDLGDVIALRFSDVSLLKIKIQILSRSCEDMERTVEEKRSTLISITQKFQVETVEKLQRSGSYLKEWNCSDQGKKYRESLRAERIQDMQIFKKNLESELDEFLVVQRNLEYAENDKNELEKRYKKSVENLKLDENNIHSKLKVTEKLLSSLYKKRKELTGAPGLDASRITQQINKTRESISFWETRVSETQRMLRSQRRQGSEEGSVKKLSKDLQMRYRVYPPSFNQSSRSPPTKIRVLETQIQKAAIETGQNNYADLKNNTSEVNEESDYDFSAPSKNPRMFQFKKKPNLDSMDKM